MTNAELNRDIKRLYKKTTKKMNPKTPEEWRKYEGNKEEIQKEFRRLYFADSEAIAMNYASFKMMLSINLSNRFIELHQMFNSIKIK